MTRLKVWAVRLGILALIVAGFGGVFWGIFQSISAGVAGAGFGVVLFARRAWRVGSKEIAF
ncbi:hypothetical protein [Pleomorphomonas koreensis]|uniref:hypothetical protein n=1 Tax=Pleomorphomonas koreensis TaxID=257440 RepID=UPI0003F736A1|nr:hypothetical protein [Pleomorphomonas koreensis]